MYDIMTNYLHKGTAERRTLERRAIVVARKKGILRARDLAAAGIPRVVLTRLCRSARLDRLSRGLYALPEAEITEHHSLAEVAKKVPSGVICLLSALRFHGFTTQDPFDVWVAIDAKARRPRMEGVALRVMRFSGSARTYGVEERRIEGVTVRVTSAAKTVADCFKYRNKIGLDVALEALRDYRRARKSREELWRAAEACRVTSVMRPYMEAIG